MSAGIFQVLQHRRHKTDKNLTSEVDILMQSLLQLAFSLGGKRRGAYNCDANKQKTRGGWFLFYFFKSNDEEADSGAERVFTLQEIALGRLGPWVQLQPSWYWYGCYQISNLGWPRRYRPA